MVFDGLHRVTGVLSPDTTGDYLPDGLHNGQMSYADSTSTWFIAWNGIANWFLSTIKGAAGPNFWSRADPDVEGLYTPGGAATGIATITEI